MKAPLPQVTRPGDSFHCDSPARAAFAGVSVGRWLYWLDGWPLVRHLVLERAFRRVFLMAAILAATGGLSLARIWTVTPAGIQPAQRIRLLDLVQGMALARTARGASCRGDHRLALWAWRAALSHNPGSIPHLHHALQWARGQSPRDPGALGLALQQGFWHLRLTGTNDSALDAVIPAWCDLGLDDAIRWVSISRPGTWPPEAQLARVKAQLRNGVSRGQHDSRRASAPGEDLGDEINRLRTLPYFRPPCRASRELEWCALALAATGPSGSATALGMLESALDEPGDTSLAAALLLQAGLARRDRAMARRGLDSLAGSGRASVAHHVQYWRALAAQGDVDEARQAAEQWAGTPVHAGEASLLAQGFIELGLLDHARCFLERYETEFGAPSDLWILHAGLLVKQGKWAETRLVAARIRSTRACRPRLLGLACWLDGLAANAAGNTARAESLFTQAIREPTSDPRIARLIAGGIPPPLAAAHGVASEEGDARRPEPVGGRSGVIPVAHQR